nr:mucin-3A-like [Nomia melanderi]
MTSKTVLVNKSVEEIVETTSTMEMITTLHTVEPEITQSVWSTSVTSKSTTETSITIAESLMVYFTTEGTKTTATFTEAESTMPVSTIEILVVTTIPIQTTEIPELSTTSRTIFVEALTLNITSEVAETITESVESTTKRTIPPATTGVLVVTTTTTHTTEIPEIESTTESVTATIETATTILTETTEITESKISVPFTITEVTTSTVTPITTSKPKLTTETSIESMRPFTENVTLETSKLTETTETESSTTILTTESLVETTLSTEELTTKLLPVATETSETTESTETKSTLLTSTTEIQTVTAVSISETTEITVASSTATKVPFTVNVTEETTKTTETIETERISIISTTERVKTTTETPTSSSELPKFTTDFSTKPAESFTTNVTIQTTTKMEFTKTETTKTIPITEIIMLTTEVLVTTSETPETTIESTTKSMKPVTANVTIETTTTTETSETTESTATESIATISTTVIVTTEATVPRTEVTETSTKSSVVTAEFLTINVTEKTTETAESTETESTMSISTIEVETTTTESPIPTSVVPEFSTESSIETMEPVTANITVETTKIIESTETKRTKVISTTEVEITITESSISTSVVSEFTPESSTETMEPATVNVTAETTQITEATETERTKTIPTTEAEITITESSISTSVVSEFITESSTESMEPVTANVTVESTETTESTETEITEPVPTTEGVIVTTETPVLTSKLPELTTEWSTISIEALPTNVSTRTTETFIRTESIYITNVTSKVTKVPTELSFSTTEEWETSTISARIIETLPTNETVRTTIEITEVTTESVFTIIEIPEVITESTVSIIINEAAGTTEEISTFSMTEEITLPSFENITATISLVTFEYMTPKITEAEIIKFPHEINVTDVLELTKTEYESETFTTGILEFPKYKEAVNVTESVISVAFTLASERETPITELTTMEAIGTTESMVEYSEFNISTLTEPVEFFNKTNVTTTESILVVTLPKITAHEELTKSTISSNISFTFEISGLPTGPTLLASKTTETTFSGPELIELEITIPNLTVITPPSLSPVTTAVLFALNETTVEEAITIAEEFSSLSYEMTIPAFTFPVNATVLEEAVTTAEEFSSSETTVAAFTSNETTSKATAEALSFSSSKITGTSILPINISTTLKSPISAKNEVYLETEIVHEKDYDKEYDEEEEEEKDEYKEGTDVWQDYYEMLSITEAVRSTTEAVELNITVTTSNVTVPTASVWLAETSMESTSKEIVETGTFSVTTEGIKTTETEEEVFTLTTEVYTLESTPEFSTEYLPLDYYEHVSTKEDGSPGYPKKVTQIKEMITPSVVSTYGAQLITDKEEQRVRHKQMREQLLDKIVQLENKEKTIINKETELEIEEHTWEREKLRRMQEVIEQKKIMESHLTISTEDFESFTEKPTARQPIDTYTPPITEDTLQKEVRRLEDKLIGIENRLKEREKNLLERRNRLEKDRAEFEKRLQELQKRPLSELEAKMTVPKAEGPIVTRTTPSVSQLPPTERTTIEIHEPTAEGGKETTVMRKTITKTDEEEEEDYEENYAAPTIKIAKQQFVTQTICMNVFEKGEKEMVTKRVCLPNVEGSGTYSKEQNAEKKPVKINELQLKGHEWTEGATTEGYGSTYAEPQIESPDRENNRKRSLPDDGKVRFKRSNAYDGGWTRYTVDSECCRNKNEIDRADMKAYIDNIFLEYKNATTETYRRLNEAHTGNDKKCTDETFKKRNILGIQKAKNSEIAKNGTSNDEIEENNSGLAENRKFLQCTIESTPLIEGNLTNSEPSRETLAEENEFFSNKELYTSNARNSEYGEFVEARLVEENEQSEDNFIMNTLTDNYEDESVTEPIEYETYEDPNITDNEVGNNEIYTDRRTGDNEGTGDEDDEELRTKVEEKTRQPPGPEWPTELVTQYHIGGTRTWSIETDDIDSEDQDDTSKQSTCYDIIISRKKIFS